MRAVTIFLGGDAMTGRGVDQILPHPGKSHLREPYVRDARQYVRLAERANGPIPAPVDFSWPWGDALEILTELAPDARVINLETTITRHDDVTPGKGVHYRMTPANIGCLSAAAPDVCALANNHALDFGRCGLWETIDTLAAGRIQTAGAGRDIAQAQHPAAVPLATGGRVIVFSCGAVSSGIPLSWGATRAQGGIDLLPDLSAATARRITDRARQVKRPGDLLVTSLHWGSNWGYTVPTSHRRFAHWLIDDGVDLVHGHSSHHPRPIEIYHGKLILYGCGDCVDDYEGIGGRRKYRDDLRLLYFPTINADTGHLTELRMAPLQARQMRLRRATHADTEHLRTLLDGINHHFGPRIDHTPDGMLRPRLTERPG